MPNCSEKPSSASAKKIPPGAPELADAPGDDDDGEEEVVDQHGEQELDAPLEAGTAAVDVSQERSEPAAAAAASSSSGKRSEAEVRRSSMALL